MGEELVAYLDGIGQRTYLIHQNDSWSVINGTYEEVGDLINIISFAPYQKEFWLIDETGTRQLSEVTSVDNYLFDINK